MKKLLLVLLSALLCTGLLSQVQPIKIVSFTVKNQLPAVIDNWGTIPGSLLLVAQLPPPVRVKGISLRIQIKGGGAIICSNNSTGGLPVDEFTTRTFSANELTGSLQGCQNLKEGGYSICAQFFNGERKEISNEVCKEFTVEIPKETDYTSPTLINPDNGKVYTEAELSRPVNFRWTPLVPKPREPVTYRLKVWQLMQGQNGTQAMRTNQPIVSKDVDNITQAVVNGIYTGPCKPPYLCDFIWQVQALNKEGKPLGRNEGSSEPYSFTAENKEASYAPPKLVMPNDGKAFEPKDMSTPVLFRWTPIVPKPQEPVTYRLKVWQLMQGQSGSQAMKANKPIVTKDVYDITEAVESGIYTGPCRPPYLCDYVWQVEAITRAGTNTVISEPTTFSVTDQKGKGPGNELPEDKKQIKPDDVKNVLTFRWTPIVPKPQEPVTYRLKVWQLMQGQSGSQAMRTNKPIVTKDVYDITEAVVSGIYTGPCRPPYLCDYIWQVEAVSRNGSPGTTSDPTTFNIKTPSETEVIIPVTEYAAPNLTVPENRKKVMPGAVGETVSFRWTPIVPKPQEPVTYRLRVWQLMQGQSGSQAMRTNKPIVTKDVADITEAMVSGIYTGPCKPPYLCDFIWNVQAITNNGMSISTSKTFHFEFIVEK